MARLFRVIAALVLVVAGVPACWWWQAAHGFVLLHIRETNNRSLAAWPEAPRRPAYLLEEGDGKRRTLSGPLSLPFLFGVRVLVLWEVENEDLLLYQQVIPVRRLPAAIPLYRQLTWTGVLTGPEPGDKGPPATASVNLIDNDSRVLAGDLVVLEVGNDGLVNLAYGGRRLALHAGKAWGEARRRTPGGDLVIDAAEGWSVQIEAALASGDPVTKLTIVNHGRWYPNQIRRP